MQTPPEIVYQGIAATPAIEDAVAAHVAQLEERWGRVTACRVVVKGPSEHHRQGGLYEIHIRLALPEGREVNVDRTPTADERRADSVFLSGGKAPVDTRLVGCDDDSATLLKGACSLGQTDSCSGRCERRTDG